MINLNNAINNICYSLDNKEIGNKTEALNGYAGLALFYFYYYRYSKKEIYYDKAAFILQDVIETINNNYSNPTFFNGIAGIAWLIDHLQENNFIDTDVDSFANSVDKYLHERMLDSLYNQDFSYSYGSIGYCLYFLKRFTNTKAPDLKLKYKNYITEFIFFLENQRIKSFSGLKVFSDNKNNTSEQIVAIGNLLPKLFKLNVFSSLLTPFLEEYTNHLIKNIQQNNIPEIEIALCLKNSGNILNNKFALEKAADFLQKPNLLVNNLAINQYFKYSLIYNQLFRETNNELYKELMKEWLSKGHEGLSTNKFFNLNNSLWNGLSGIGLSLLSLSDSSLRNWQECLLI